MTNCYNEEVTAACRAWLVLSGIGYALFYCQQSIEQPNEAATMHTMPHAIQAQLSEYGSEDYTYSPEPIRTAQINLYPHHSTRLTTKQTASLRRAWTAWRARWSTSMAVCTSISNCIRADGAIVECIVTVIYDAPKEAPIMLDQRRAGGRVPGRGARGSGGKLAA